MRRTRLPNHFGSIRFLGEGRRNAYAVHVPHNYIIDEQSCNHMADVRTVNGHGSNDVADNHSHNHNADAHTTDKIPDNVDDDRMGSGVAGSTAHKRTKAICYTATWEEGYQVLVLFHAGVIAADESADTIREKLRRINGANSAYNSPHKREIEVPDDPRDKMVQYAKKMLIDLGLIRCGNMSGMPGGSGASGGSGMSGEHDMPGTSGMPGTTNIPGAPGEHLPRTFQEVYNSFIEHRFGPNAGQKRKKSTKNGYNSAWLKLEPFYNLTLDQVSVDALEARVNLVAGWGYSKTTVQRMVTLIHQLYKYAYDRGYCEGRHGLGVEMPAAKEETHHQDFTDEEIGKLWEAYEKSGESSWDPFVVDTVRMILIMIYSGFRIREYETLEFVDGEVPYFKGGMKTDAGRGRIVPVHSRILPLVKETGGVFLCGKKHGQFRRDMKNVLVEIGVDDAGGCHQKCYGAATESPLPSPGEDALLLSNAESADRKDAHSANVESDGTRCRYHTPHSTRHTFSRLCESYDVKEADRKRMLGHSLKGDITNGVYGHRSVAELSREIEKIERADLSAVA